MFARTFTLTVSAEMILQVTPHKRYSMRVAYLEIVFVVGGNCWHLEHPKFANEHEIEILTPAAAPCHCRRCPPSNRSTGRSVIIIRFDRCENEGHERMSDRDLGREE